MSTALFHAGNIVSMSNAPLFMLTTSFPCHCCITWSCTGGQDLSDSPAPVQWLAAVFFALTTVSSTGYGDIAPRTTLERCVALGFLGAGVIFFSFLVSSFTTMMSAASQEAKRCDTVHGQHVADTI